MRTSPRLFEDARAGLPLIGLLDEEPASARGRRTEAVLVSLSREFAGVDANPKLTGAHYTSAPMVNFEHFRKYQQADIFSPRVRARPIELIRLA